MSLRGPVDMMLEHYEQQGGDLQVVLNAISDLCVAQQSGRRVSVHLEDILDTEREQRAAEATDRRLSL